MLLSVCLCTICHLCIVCLITHCISLANINNTGNKISKGEESVSFTHVAKDQSTLYTNVIRRCCENAALVSPRLASFRRWETVRSCGDVTKVILLSGSVKVGWTLSLKGIGVIYTVDAQTSHSPASHRFIQPVSLTSGLSVLTAEINDNGKVCVIRQEEPQSVLSLFCIVAFFCVICLIQF